MASPAWFLTIAAGVLVYAIIAVCIRNRAELTFCLCPQHRRKRGRYLLAATLMLIVGLPGLFIALGWMVVDNHAPQPWLGIGTALCGAMTVLSLIWFVTKGQVLSAKRISESGAWYRGAGEAFLQAIE